MPAIADRSYSSGTLMLELGGAHAGILSSVEGGEPFANVIEEPRDAAGIVRKHAGPVAFHPIVLSFANGMTQEFYDWVAEALSGEGSARAGAVVGYDYNSRERWRLEFDPALITEITFPDMDAQTRTKALFAVKLQPERTQLSTASAGTLGQKLSSRSKALLTSNFRFSIRDLETECRKVNKIDSFTVRLSTQPGAEPGQRTLLSVPDLSFTVAESEIKGFRSWFDDLVLRADAEEERSGVLEFLDEALKTALFTVEFSHLGILSIRNERLASGADVIARSRVQLYCEEMNLTYGKEATSGGVSPDVAPPSPPSSLRAPIAPPDVIARRLTASAGVETASLATSRRNDGYALGERWAAETATLQELDEVSALEPGNWTSMRLENRHSLIARLREAGIMPLDEESLEMERDEFVEGVVAGASGVLRSAAPHLGRTPHK